MTTDPEARLHAAIDALYAVFKEYPPGEEFCPICYDPGESRYIRTTPVRGLDRRTARTLLWEAGCHWESAEVFRHYLPRMLAALAPPELEMDLYPSHLFESLRHHAFECWPQPERLAVLRFIAAVTPFLDGFDDEDRREWQGEVDALREER